MRQVHHKPGHIAVLTGILLILFIPNAHAQTVNTVGNLFISNGSELDFRLYGANGGASDKIAVQGQFSFSSAGSYIVGFSHNDAISLQPGSVFDLITFNNTNFSPADASHFTPTVLPGGGLSAISGTFSLSPPDSPNGIPGILQFHLLQAVETPEPGSLLLFGAGAVGTMLRRKM